jgi:hypothetical protein
MTAPAQREVGSATQPCPLAKKDWIEIQLVGEDDEGIADEVCVVTGPDGATRTIRTDALGWVRIEGLPTGKCAITFPDLDTGAWQYLRSTQAR